MQTHTYKSIPDFTARTRQALVHQKQQQITQFKQTVKVNTSKQLEQMGLALTGLKLKSSKGGLYGRTLYTLQHHLFPRDEQTDKKILEKFKLPESRFGVGDNVGIYTNTEYIQDKPLVSGVVHKRSEYKIVISIDVNKDKQKEKEGEEDEKYLEGMILSVCCTINEVTYHRYQKVLEALEQTDYTHKSKAIIDSLFNYIRLPENHQIKPLEFTDESLNQIQKQAVTKSISTGSVHLIHGPPGTGKTKTICEVISQGVKRGWKILATAGSNIAVDNIVERIGSKVKVCRIGHPSRMIESVYNYCLDNLIYKSSFQKVIKDLKRQLDQKRIKYSKLNDRAQRKQLRNEMKDLRQEIIGIEQASIKQVLNESQVICCTNTGAGDRIFRHELSKTTFDLVVIDQCAQSIQISNWIPLLKGKRAILAGDHLQLPPTIKSSKSQKILSYTLFDRAMKECPVTNTLLTIQYRMNKMIMDWSSKEFYQGKLEADKLVSEHDLKSISASTTNTVPIMYINTEGCEMGQNLDKESSDVSKSKFNVGEADIVKVVVQELIAQGLENQHIGIISPYNAQVSLIKNLIQDLQTEKNKIEVSTVDGFQGRQKECIIISMVRSNPIKQIGFLADFRRMNVAVTRAKRFVCLIGDSMTVSSDKHLKSLVEYFSEHGELRNAIEFKVDENVRFGSGWVKHNNQDKQKQKEKGDTLTKTPSLKQQQSKKKKNKKKQSSKNQQLSPTNQPQKHPTKLPTASFQPLHQAQQKYIPQIQIFLSSKQTQLTFENLSGFDRKIVHSIAEQFGLQHETSPDKTKLVLKKNVPFEIDEKKEQQLQELSQCAQEEFVKYTELSAKQRKELIKIAHKLSLITQFDNQSNQLKIKNKIEKQFNIQKPKPVKPKKKKAEKNKVQQQEEFDEAAFLEAIAGEDKKCNFKGIECKAKVEHLGMRCQFCERMFCVKHCLAETHGCGERASAHALEKHKAQYIKYTDDYISDKEKNALRQKLQKKIKESEKGRTQQIKKQKK